MQNSLKGLIRTLFNSVPSQLPDLGPSVIPQQYQGKASYSYLTGQSALHFEYHDIVLVSERLLSLLTFHVAFTYLLMIWTSLKVITRI